MAINNSGLIQPTCLLVSEKRPERERSGKEQSKKNKE